MSIVQEINFDLESIAQRIRASMVRVETQGRGSGAGTIWHPEGLILTNAHVAASSELFIYNAEGDRYPAQVLARDHHLDLAAVSVNASGLQVMELGSTSSLRPGDFVFAMGFPWGVDGGLTAGNFIGKETWWPRRSIPQREWIMASLHLRPGHSGGPMVDSKGELIGINTIMRGPDVGVAIPIETVKGFLKATLGKHQKAA